MTAQFIYAVVACAGAVFGLIAGRVFAVEGETRLGALFAATYVGAGAGLTSAIPLGSVLALIAEYLNEGSSTWFNALDVAGKSLLWGTAAGAAAGLAVSIVVVGLSLRRLDRPVLRDGK
jgi:hypothetical protein